MKILVYGAGVIGSVYAAHLHHGGHEVSVLARGQRLADIREHGIIVEAAASGRRLEAKVSAVEAIEPEDAYDLVLVAVQKGHFASVLPILAANRNTPTVAFVGNNAAGSEPLTGSLGTERVLMGFPGFGGYFEGSVVRYASEGRAVGRLVLTLGELDGRTTPRIHTIVQSFADAGIEVAVTPNIDAWLKAPVAMVVPILFALRRHDGDHLALARDRATLRLMSNAVREGLTALRRLGYPIKPFRLKTITWLPLFLTVTIFGKIIGSDFAKVAFVGHAKAAAAEFDVLIDELHALVAESDLATPALDELCTPRG